MNEITIIDYTTAYHAFIDAHPEESIHRNCEAYVITCNGQVIESVIRCLN